MLISSNLKFELISCSFYNLIPFFHLQANFTSDPDVIKIPIQGVNKKKLNQDYIITSDYNTHTNEQVHAELFFGEMNIMHDFLLLLADKTILALLRASMKMRYSYGCLKECHNMIKTKTN